MQQILQSRYTELKPLQIARQLAKALLPQHPHRWQEELLGESTVFEEGDLLCIAPTGCGKTAIGFAAMIPALVEARPTIFLATTRALARERCRDLTERLAPLGFRVALSTRDDRQDDPAIRDAAVDVIVTVYEKAQSLVLQSSALMDRLGLVVADEAQLLLEPTRGPAATLLVETLRRRRVRLVALSAAVGLRHALQEHFGLMAVGTEDRVTPLQIGTIRLDRGTADWLEPDGTAVSRRILDPVAAEEDPTPAIRRLVEEAEKPVLLFFPSRGEALAAARSLAEHSSAQVDFVADERMGAGRIAGLLARGVGLHTAEQSRSERRAVEDLLLAGRLPICCCTTTLAEGINAPVKTVFLVPGPEDDAARRANCLGRAGRPEAGPGKAWILSRGPVPLPRPLGPPRGCAVALTAFLLAADWNHEEALARVGGLGFEGVSTEEIKQRGFRLGMWDKDGALTAPGRILAHGGLEADAVAGWRTTLRRFPNGGSEVANVFLAVGAARAGDALPLSHDERLSARWITDLTEELAASSDPLARHYLDFLTNPDTLARRLHQAAKGALILLRAERGMALGRLAEEFLVPEGLVESFLDQATYLRAQLARLARQLGGELEAAQTPIVLQPAPARIVAVHASPADSPVRLVIKRGSTGLVVFDGTPIHLTPLQFRLLGLLARHAGDGIPYERVENYVWQQEAIVERQQISYHKSRLEKRLLEASTQGESRLIETQASWGIRLLLDRSNVQFEQVAFDEEPLLREALLLGETNSVAWTVGL